MRIRKFVQSPLLASCQTARFGGRPCLAVTAFLGFNMDGAPGALSPADAFLAASGSLGRLADQGVILDHGLPKSRGEFLAVADAYPPPGVPRAATAAASFRVGQAAREFLAVGEAPLLGPAPGEPAPFVSVPLDWRRTSRGGHNPHGQARGITRTAYGAALGYPQVSDLRAAGGALAASWPPPASPLPEPFGARIAASGTYGRGWLLDAWPGFPADFDMDALSLAQPGQRLREGFFRGDEAVSASGIHPHRAGLSGRLPGLAARIVLARLPQGAEPPEPPAAETGPGAVPPPSPAPPGGLVFEEVRLSLDTVWLFPIHGAGIMIWHGMAGLSDPLGSEAWGLAAAAEPLYCPAGPPGELFGRGLAGFPPLPVIRPFSVTAPPAPAPEPEPEPEPEPSPGAAAAGGGAPGPGAGPGEPAPAGPPAPQPPAPVPVTAAAVMADARKTLAEDLPEINRVLGENGLRPLTLDELNASLDRFGGAIHQGFELMDKASAEAAAAAALPPAERAAADQARMAAELVRGGVPPEEAEGLARAAGLPVPLRADFKSAGDFERALSEYGGEWARLTGCPPDTAALHVERARLASVMREDPAGGLEALLSQKLGKEKAAELARQLVLPPAPGGPVALADALAEGGLFPPEEAGAMARAIAHLDGLPPGAGLAEITEALSGYEAAMTQGLGIGASPYVGRMLRNFRAMKPVFWKDPALGKALEGIAGGFPQLWDALPEITRLRLEEPGRFASLAEMARSAGVSDPAALAAVSSADPWTGNVAPPPTAPEGGGLPGPGPGAGPEAGPDDPGPAAPGRSVVLATRAEVEALAEAARRPPSDPAPAAGTPLPAGAASLSGRVMQGLVLSGIDLGGLDLSGARLTGSDLSGARLAGADLSGAALDGCLLGGADLSGARLAGADLSRVSGGAFSLAGADLSGADLAGADLSGCALAGARAPRASFVGARLPLDLRETDLAGASFARWDGQGADLSGCDLEGASFTSCNLAGASFAGARMGRCSFFACDLSRAVFQEAAAPGIGFYRLSRAPGADFSGADVSGSTFDIRDVSGAVFAGARGDRASFAGALLRGASFQGGSFREAVFHEADLRGADFYGCDLMKAVFGGAQLSGAVFAGASLFAADFYLSRPDGTTDFQGADLTRTVLMLDSERLVR
jgi:uncharacterized protein YjbI with pentapeptide repeats